MESVDIINVRDGDQGNAMVQNHHADIKYPVFMIFSRWGLDDIKNFIESHEKNSVGLLRVVYGLQGETNKTVALITETVYQIIVDKGLHVQAPDHNFAIARYELQDHHYPPAGCKNTIFIPFPEALQSTVLEAENCISMNLNKLVTWGILPKVAKKDPWRLVFPKYSREWKSINNNSIYGCFITWAPENDIPIEAIIFTKIVLHDTYWDTNKTKGMNLILKCKWARDKTSFASSRNSGNPPRYHKSRVETKSEKTEEGKKEEKTEEKKEEKNEKTEGKKEENNEEKIHLHVVPVIPRKIVNSWNNGPPKTVLDDKNEGK